MTDDEFKNVVVEWKRAPDAAAKAALRARLDAEIARRTAAPAAPAAPLYPVGLAAALGDKRARVLSAKWDGTTWQYTVEVDAGPLIPTFSIARPEIELRALLAEHAGQPAGPAYPRGVVLLRNGQAAAIDDARAEGGTYTYQVRGWPARVSEADLAAALAR